MDVETAQHIQLLYRSLTKFTESDLTTVELIHQLIERVAVLEHQIFPTGPRPDDLPLMTAVEDLAHGAKARIEAAEKRISELENLCAEFARIIQGSDEF